MNQVSQQEEKKSTMTPVALAVFISIIVFIAWAAVQLVNLVPNAFGSLASLAESMNQYEKGIIQSDRDSKELIVTSNTKLVNVNETVDLSWSTTEVPGSYTFAYECKDGVSVDIINNTSGIGSINCDTNYNIGNTDNLSLLVNSEKERYQDINYTLSFLGTNDTNPRAVGNASLTVVNSDINDITIADVVESTTNTAAVAGATTDSTSQPETSTESVGTTPKYEQEFVYTIPTSNPNGRTDLSTRLIGIGNIVNNTFFLGEVTQNKTGAVQFEVKNYGTKTSKTWTYEVTLPGSGVYTSPEQAPLKPNERAVITLGFPTTDEATHTFKAEIVEGTDNNLTNNKFSEVVTFTK